MFGNSKLRFAKNLYYGEIMETSVEKVLPYCINREPAFVPPSASIRAVMILLIPLKSYYNHGLLVVNNQEVVGFITPYDVMKSILKYGKGIHELCAEDIMRKIRVHLCNRSLVKDVVKVFQTNQCDFHPLQNGKDIGTTISSLDIVSLVSRTDLDIKAKSIGSKLVLFRSDITVKDTLQVLIDNGIKEIAIKTRNGIKIINDRNLLEHVLNTHFKNSNFLYDKVRTTPSQSFLSLPDDIRVNVATKALINNFPTTCVLGDSVISPWDILMKIH